MIKKIKFSYTIGLVLVGMILALLSKFGHTGTVIHLAKMKISSKVILYLLLPSLIFEAAIHINTRLFIKNLKPILALAIPGLFISMLIIGFAASYFTTLSLSTGLLFGALISATDPVAVIQIFREIGAPKRLTMLVDGESLLNDAAAIFAFGIIFSAIKSPFQYSFSIFSLLSLTWNFVYIFTGGILVGFIITSVTIKIISSAKRDPLIQIAAMTFVAYMTFMIAEYYLHVSGVMAVLTSGILLSWYMTTNLKTDVKNYVHQFWAYLAFLANSIIFLTLGTTEFNFMISYTHTENLLSYIFWIIIFVLIARCVVVYAIIPIMHSLIRIQKISEPYKHVIFWGGLRGAIPLSLAFSLNNSFEHQKLIVELTLAVVLFSLLVQGTTLRSLIDFFQLNRRGPCETMNKIEAQLNTKYKGLERICELEDENCFDKKVITNFKARYNLEISHLREKLRRSEYLPGFRENSMKKELWYHAILIEEEVYYKLFDQSFISKAVLHELILNIDSAKDSLKQEKFPEIFIIHVPIETIMKSYIGRIGMHFFSRNPFVLKMIKQAYITKYEISISMIIACNHIRSMIDKICEIYKFEEETINECIQFYDRRKKLAETYINNVDEEDVPTAFRQGKIHLLALSAEYDELNKLAADHQVLKKNYLDLKNEIEPFLDELKEKVECNTYDYIRHCKQPS